jgi:hypothetical protein
VATIIVLFALNAMFKTAVYLYATTGAVPSGLDASLVAGAFRPKGLTAEAGRKALGRSM